MARQDKNLSNMAKSYFSGLPFWANRRVWETPTGRLWLVPGGFCSFSQFPRNGLHVHDYFEVCLVLSGTGRFRHGEQVWPLRRGDAFLAEPSILHEIDSLQTRDLTLWFLSFGWEPRPGGQTVDVSPGDFAGTLLPAFRKEHRLHQSGLHRLFPYIDLVGSDGGGAAASTRDSLLIALLTETLLAFTPAERRGQSSGALPVSPPVHLKRALSAIDRQLEDRLSLPAVARAAGVSVRSLTRHFRFHLGRTVQQVYTERKLLRAQNLLSMNLTVTQVSELLGYPVPSQFSRAFKQHFGVSPKAYQQQVLERS